MALTQAVSMGENLILILFLGLTLVSGATAVFLYTKHRSETKWSPRALLVGNLVVFLLLCSAVLLGGEIYFRFFYDATGAYGLTKTTKRWFERHFKYNRFGFRDSTDDYRSALQPGIRRLTFLGDSFTAGHGIANVEKRFVNQIREKLAPSEVHIFARPGADTGEEIATFEAILQTGYEIDTVVLVYCLNDIADIVPEWQLIARQLYDREDPGFLVRESYFVNKMFYWWMVRSNRDMANYYEFILRNYGGVIWNQQIQRLRFLNDLVTSRRGKLLAVTFPFLHELGPQYRYQKIHDKLQAAWTNIGVSHLDLLKYFQHFPPGELTVNNQDPHPNERAHAIAATTIIDFLEKNSFPTSR